MTYMIVTWKNDDFLKISIKSGKPQNVEFTDLALIPGSVNEYKLRVITDKKSEYDITFDFQNLADAVDALDDNLYVKIEYGGRIYYEDKLAAFYENNDCAFTVDLTDNYYTDILLTYYIPIEVGNEIQGCVADFNLQVTAQEKRD